MLESQNLDEIRDKAKTIRMILNMLLKVPETAESFPPCAGAILDYMNKEYIDLEKLLK